MTHALDHEPLAWQADANCATVDPDQMFPAFNESPANAKSVCAHCDVAAVCLQYALDNHLAAGIYGGTTAFERRGMRGVDAA